MFSGPQRPEPKLLLPPPVNSVQPDSTPCTAPYCDPLPTTFRTPLPLPPPIGSMPRATTNADRDLVWTDFLACYNALGSQKNDLISATSGTDRKNILDLMSASLASLGPIVARMKKFPPGGWNSDDLEDIADWTKEIRRLDGSRTLREVVISLQTYSGILMDLFEPIQFDEEGSDKAQESDGSYEDEEAPNIKSETGGTSIHVMPRSYAPDEVAPEEDTPIVMNPKVCFGFLARIYALTVIT